MTDPARDDVVDAAASALQRVRRAAQERGDARLSKAAAATAEVGAVVEAGHLLLVAELGAVVLRVERGPLGVFGFEEVGLLGRLLVLAGLVVAHRWTSVMYVAW